MARLINRLSKRQVQRLALAGEAGFFADGNGLFLQITERGTASWVSQYKFRKRRHKMGLGALPGFRRINPPTPDMRALDQF